MNVVPGKPETNFETIKASVAEAVAKHAELVVFPSFCLSGAMAGDLFLQQSFREKCNKFGEKIIALSKNIDIIFGNIDRENRNKVIHASAGKLAEKPLTQCSVRIDCSPFAVGLSETRLSSLGSDAKRTGKPILFVNAVGTENTGKRIFAFDGCSAAINADGSIAYQFPAFEAFSALVDVQANKVTSPSLPAKRDIPFCMASAMNGWVYIPTRREEMRSENTTGTTPPSIFFAPKSSTA